MAACIIALLLAAVFTDQNVRADCQPTPTGLIGWWAGDGNANNVLGTNNGTLQGGATANATGRVGLAFNFDGTNNFVQIPDSPILRPTNLTIEAWVRFNGLDTPGTAEVGRQYLVFKQNPASTDFEGYDLSKTRVGGNDVFEFRVSTASGQSVAATATTLIATGVWYHVAAVRSTNFLQIYVNGQLQRQTNVTFAQSYGTLPLYFGSSGQAFWDRKFRGTLDEVTLYNRALSSNEIAAIYNIGIGGKCKEVVITTSPQSQNAQIGSNVNFSVVATGFGPLRYRWMYNGATIAGATNATYGLTSVQPSSAGNYAVAVSNTLNVITSATAVLTVSTPPIITNAPQSQTVISGGSANFIVGAGGTAPLSFQWRKGNLPLNGQTAATLSLANVTTSDAGNYDVVVTNLVGAVTSTPPATLTVNTPAFITLGPQSQTTVVGSNVSFSVIAGGTAPLTYQWRKTGTVLPGQTSAILSLPNVTTADAASYDVVVTNVAGAVTSSPPATLTVNVPPFISVPPASQTVVQGSNVNWTVVASGTAPLSYQWRKGGLPLLGQTTANLTLLSATTDNAGNYDVVVTNVAGAVTSTPPATLTVNVPPFISIPPQSQSVVLGTNVTFSVNADGTQPLSYSWQKNGSPLNNQTTGSLVLMGVTTNDAGSYTVIITNVAGAVTSSPPAALVVNVPPSITTAPQNQTTIVGSNVSFSVVASGTAPLSYQWRKDGGLLEDQNSEMLQLANVASNDAGNYDVIVSNVAGVVTSTPPATLIVNVPPLIVGPPQSQVAVVGSNVNFSVFASGTAPLSYQWRKGGGILNGRTGPLLALLSVSTNDAGNYDVVVSNVAGVVTSTPPATLIVNVPPFITVPPQNQTATVGSDVIFSVLASGTTPLSYQWRKGGGILTGQTGPLLALLAVSTNDAGNYDVVVSNVAGVVTSTPPATLTVNVPPFITGLPQSQAVTAGSNVSFSVIAGGTAPLNYQWRKGGANLFGQTGTTLSLSSVSPSDAGNYDVVVANVAGAVTSSPPAVLTVNVLPFITNAPQSQTVTEGNFVSLSVGAGGTAPLSFQWRKGGANLFGQTGTTLSFPSVTLADAGNYDVVVVNVAGSVTSTPPATLTVMSSASGYPTITNPPQSQTVVLAANVTFSVGVSGSQPLRYQWRKQGANLPNQTNGTLQLLSVVSSDAANYDVVVTNSVGAVTSAPPAILTILPQVVSKPSVTNQPQSKRVGVGTSVSFVVGATGTDPLSYQWRRNNSPLVGQTSSTLALSNVSTNNDGNYDVVITNVAGSVTSLVANLSVKLVVDPALEQAITCALTNQSSGLTAADLLSVTNLTMRNRGITNLFGLQYALNLASLDASQNQIADLSPLQGLSRLNSLELDDNRGEISTLSPLSGLSNLTCLVLGQVYPTTYTPLSSLSNLTSLVIRKGNVANLNFLQNLRRLSSLSLPQNNIRSISPLAGLTNLGRLDLRWNPTITNYSALQSGLSNLASLQLAGNAVTNLPSLQNLVRLRLLDVAGNELGTLPNFSVLTNLSYVVLSRNPLIDYSALGTLSNLTHLELSGNSISNAAVLSNLRKLIFLDLSYNRITDLSPLTSLTNLQSLTLAGNRPTSFAPLASLGSLSNLWIQNCSISNIAFAASLVKLRHLNLDDNFITDVSPVLGLTNLTGLGLSRNPATNALAVSSLRNLTGLRLEGDSLTEMSALTNLFRLAYLSLSQNRLTNVMGLAALTNLQNHYLWQNRLKDISYAQFLARPVALDLSLNLLSPTNGSLELAVVEALRCQTVVVPQCACALPTNAPPVRGVDVSYSKQHSAPAIFATDRWYIPWNAPSSLDFAVSYGANPADPLPVSASSSNPGLIDNAGLAVGLSNVGRSLIASPKSGQIGNTAITLTVMNEGGLTTSTSVLVSVLAPVDVEDMMSPGVPLSADLEFAFRQATGKANGELTSVDLLNITQLVAPDADPTGFLGWQWLTNLTTLFIRGGDDLGFLTNLTQLRSLHLFDPAPAQLAKVSALTNLVELELSGLTVSNLSVVTPLTGLKSLTVTRTRVADLTPLSTLTNLTQVRLQRNMLADILTLYSLPQLIYVDVRYNLMAFSAGSLPSAIVSGLQSRGVSVDYLPQRAAPVIDIANAWNISGNRTSALSFGIFESGEIAYYLTGVGSHSSNAGLLPDSNLSVGLDTNSISIEWALIASPIPGQSGSTIVTISATNDVGLNSSTSLVVTVSQPLPLDSNLFGTTNAIWQTSGNVGWFGQSTISVSGFPAAQSGAVSHNQSSILESTFIGPGTLRYWWKVSSEADYDWLIFESADVTNQISGEVDWEEQVISIAPRIQTVRWRYAKDVNAAQGMDAGWVAHVTFTPAIWLDLLGAPTNAHSQIALYGIPGEQYAMEISTNALNWQQLGTVLSTNRITPFVDTVATNTIRFYRARTLSGSPLLGLTNQTEADSEVSLPGNATPVELPKGEATRE